MTPRKKRTTPTKTYERRIRTQRQREEELQNTNLKKSIEEEGEHEIDVSSTNVESDDRAVEEEQNDIAIPEKETSPIVELSPLSPSPDNFIVKSIRTILEEQKLSINFFDVKFIAIEKKKFG
ncbi:hypothetical protein KY284_008031 [Solanum tuberosum]|nr:hypothetical protein KY284_008031 [Solanum tuberosum]